MNVFLNVILILSPLVFLSAPSGFAKPTTDPAPFSRSYTGIEITRNFPVSFSEKQFSPGKAHPTLAYRFILDNSWIMGLFGGFRMLRTKESSEHEAEELPFLSLAHESSRILRLYHPTYFAGGFRLLYLMPATHGMIPTGKAKEFKTEFGASLTATFLHLIDERKILSLRLERWRGTGSSNYHGVEVAAGIGISFD